MCKFVYNFMLLKLIAYDSKFDQWVAWSPLTVCLFNIVKNINSNSKCFFIEKN
jgi:hypothetical protein